MTVFNDGSLNLINTLIKERESGSNSDKTKEFNEICNTMKHMTDEYKIFQVVKRLKKLDIINGKDVKKLIEKGIIPDIENDLNMEYVNQYDNIQEVENKEQLENDDDFER